MLSISAFLFSMVAAAVSPASNLVIAPCDAGEHYQFEMITCPIELKNVGGKPIRVSKAEARMPSDSIDSGEVVVAPHSTSYITARVSLNDSFGYTRRAFRFATDEQGQPHRGSNVGAFVSTVLDQQAPILDFGTVNLEAAMPEKSLALSSREVKDFRVLAIVSKPAFLDVSIAADGRTIHARMRPNAPLGLLQQEKIKLKINGAPQSQAWITVNADVHGDVVPSGNPLSFGLMRTGSKNEFLLRLSSRSGKDFRVGSVSLDGVKGKAEIAPCVPVDKGCKLARIIVADDQPLGRVEGALKIELPEYKQTLQVQLVGMLLTPDYPIHDFEKEVEKRSAAIPQSSLASVATPKVDIKGAIKQTVSQTEEALPSGKGPLLRWAVANQDTIYGYLIYRADAESGPFLRVNKEIIRVVSIDDIKSGSYAWRDNSAESGKTYWYYVGLVKNDGSKKDLSGPQKIIAK